MQAKTSLSLNIAEGVERSVPRPAYTWRLGLTSVAVAMTAKVRWLDLGIGSNRY